MTERKYTLEEVFGYTNGESNYWKIHENNEHTRTLITDDNFDSFEDRDYLWFHLVDRGLTFCVLKDDMDLFLAHIGKTVESNMFNSWSDETHWTIQFREGGFAIQVPQEDMNDLYEKINDTVDVSTYEECVTHTKNSDEVDKVMQQRKESE